MHNLIKKNFNSINKLLLILIFFIPALVITGPFLPDLFISILSLIFLFYFFKKKISYEFIINFKYLFIFWVLIIISSLTSNFFKESLVNSLVLFRFVFFIIFFYFLYINYKKNYFFYIALVIIFFTIVDAYIQLFIGKNIFGFIKDDPKRLSGLFGDEYILGSFLLKFWPILFFLAPENKKINNILVFIFLTVVEPLIFFAGQRSSFIMSIFLVLGIFILNFKNKVFYISLLISILIIGLNLFFNKKYNERYIYDVKANFSYENIIDSKINEIEKETLNFSIISPPHTQTFYNSYLLFKDKPFFGHGIKSFRKVCNNYNEIGCTTHSHNFYIQLLAETGIFVFLFVVLFYIKLIIEYFEMLIKFFKKKTYINKSYFAALNLLIILFPFQTTGNFFNNHNLVQLSFILSIYLISKKIND